MNDNDNNNNRTNKSNPPPSQPSSNQKDPPPTETAAATVDNIGEDDKAKLENKEDSSVSISPKLLRENDAENHKQRLKIKSGEDIRVRNSTPFTNDTSDVQENTSESPSLSSNAETKVPFADEEEADAVIPTSLNEEGVDLEQHGGTIDEDIEHYEMHSATAVNASEGVLVTPHAEPDALVDEIVIADAKILAPWYKQKVFYVTVFIMMLIVVVAVVITIYLNSKSLQAPSSNPSLAPSYVPSLSVMPSTKPSLSSSAPSFSPYQVLKDLYESTAGDNWKSNSNWLSTIISLCNWYGVTCDDNSESITKISLSWNRLQGSIPSSISNLSSLDMLDLYLNALTGTIPTEVGLLSSLDGLYLQVNSLTGTIPSEVGLLSSLEELYLYLNSLTGTIPTEVGLLSSLNTLYLNNTQMYGTIPIQVCNLINSGSLSIYISGTGITNTC